MAKDTSWLRLIFELVEALFKGLGRQNRVRTWHQHVVPYEEAWAVRREGINVLLQNTENRVQPFVKLKA